MEPNAASTHSMTEITSPTASMSQKRKASHMQGDLSADECDAPREYSVAPSDTSESVPSKNEYETGRVKCEGCGEEVSFRDQRTGGFTTQLWEAHRLKCPNISQPQIAQSLAQSTQTRQSADTSIDMSEPQAKRRRSKRTEEERIEYLRNDPYVAQFEAYRVLCACCDKWIRLRPNSTYCSIPWDAHRKSCLAKKAKYFPHSAKTVCDDRAAIFAADPHVRKFDSERVLCRNCEGWINIGVVSNAEAAKLWMGHRSACQRNVFYGQGSGGANTGHNASPAIHSVPPPSRHLLALASSSSLPPPVPAGAISPSTHSSTSAPSSSSLSSMSRDHGPASSASQEPKRRSAEQRFAQLQADPLIGEIEPSRVFCTMCQKWVQLRQDSTYCSYPWEQHREKCLKRRQARSRRQAEKDGCDPNSTAACDVTMSANGDRTSDDAQSEGDDSEEVGETRTRVNEVPGRMPRHAEGAPRPAASGHNRHITSARGPVTANGNDGSTVTWPERVAVGRPSRLADLQTARGRLEYTYRAIRHLFDSTYEPTDDLTIAALVTYLNAAMPPDKHEEFDTAEVTKAAMALQTRGQFALEGDVLRIIS